MPIGYLEDIVDEAPATTSSRTARIEDVVDEPPALLPRPRPADLLTRPAQPPLPADIDAQRAWSLSPARDAMAVRRRQPAAPEPIEPVNDPLGGDPLASGAQGTMTLEQLGQVPGIGGVVRGVPQLARGVMNLGRAAVDTMTTPIAPPPRPSSPMEFWRQRTMSNTALGQFSQAPGAPVAPETLNAASDVLEGGFATLEPLLIASGIAKPLQTLTSLVAAYGASKATEQLATQAGLTPEQTRLLSDVAGAVGVATTPVARAGFSEAAAWGRRRTAARQAEQQWPIDVKTGKRRDPGTGDVIDVVPVPEPAGAPGTRPAGPAPVPPAALEPVRGPVAPAGTARITDIVDVVPPASAAPVAPPPAAAQILEQVSKEPHAAPIEQPNQSQAPAAPAPAPSAVTPAPAAVPQEPAPVEAHGVATVEDVVDVAPVSATLPADVRPIDVSQPAALGAGAAPVSAPVSAAPTDQPNAAALSPEPAASHVAPNIQLTDLSRDLAVRAHSGTSFTPEKRGESEQQGYVDHMTKLWAEIDRRVQAPELKQAALERFEEYRRDWLQHYAVVLSRRGRVMSAGISGPSNYPVRRQQKLQNSYEKASREFLEWDKKARGRLMGDVDPQEPRAISADRDDATQALQQKIDQAVQLQERMKAANTVVKNKKLSDEQKIAELREQGFGDKIAHELLKPDYMGRVGFPDYELTNNAANIRRMRERITSITSERGKAPLEATFEGGRVEENTADNRVQVFFDKKPDEALRATLKANGFKWAPSVGAWQRQRNDAARQAVERVIGVKLTPSARLEAPHGQGAEAGAPPQIETGDPGTRHETAAPGETPTGVDRRSSQGTRVSKIRERENELLDKVVNDAVAGGFAGDTAALRRELEERAQAMREIKAEVDAAGGTANALIREIVKAGGISIGNETALKGEIRWLRESDLGKRWGFFTGRRKGLTFDGMVEYLRQDPRFQHIEHVNDLVDELTDIAQGETSLGELTARELGAVGEQWWENVLPQEKPAEIPEHVDDLEARRMGMPEDLADDVNLVNDEARWLRAVKTPGESVRVDGGVVGKVVEGAADPVNGTGKAAMALVEYEFEGQLAQRWHSALELEPAAAPPETQTAQVVDILDTGEQQPRLEGAADVRKPGAAPTFELPTMSNAPFELSGRATPERAAKDAEAEAATRPGLFDLPAPPRKPPQASAPKGGGGGTSNVGSFSAGDAGRPAPIPQPADRRLFPGERPPGVGSAQPMQFPELVDLARELQGVPAVVKAFRHPGKLGEFSDRGIRLTSELFKPGQEYQLAATLAHEIGHLVDFLPHKTLKRGNLLGRLYSLRNFLKHTFTADDGAIIENKVIRAELQALSDTWRPWDPAKASASFRKYRHSGKELYADALSVLLNDPLQLKRAAPTFYKEFFAALDRKPDVRQAYFDLQEVLAGTPEELITRRRAGVRRMFEEGDVAALDLERRRLHELAQRGKDLWFRLKLQLVDKNYAVIDRVAKLSKDVRLADDENPIYLLEERNYLGGKLKAFAEKHFAPVFLDVTEHDVHWNAFGEALFYERIIAGDRSEMANPRGLSPEHARELYASLKKELGAERAAVIERNIAKFRAPVKRVAEEAYEVELYTDELYQQMQENPAYVTFQVIDHLESGVTSRVYRQVGTLKDIVNPADATILKTLVTMRAIEHQRVKTGTFKFLERHFSSDIANAKTVWSGKGHRPIESKDPKQRLITYYQKGKLAGKYVDPYVADMLENATIGENLAVVTVLRRLNSAVWRPVFTTFNLGFQAFNNARDFARFWKNVPTMTVGRALQRYWTAVPLARARAFGMPAAPTPAQRQAYLDLLDAQEARLLSVTFNDLATGRELADTQIEDILSRVGVGGFQPSKRNRFVRPITALLDGVRELGDFIETLPKAAAIYEFKGAGAIADIPAAKRSFIRRKVGSPDFLSGGTAKPITNEVALFSNAVTQAVRSDLEVATDPATRSGFWWKTARANLLPKLLLAAGLVGLFGETVRRLLERTTEYDRTNYIVVPLGEDAAKNTVYLRIPQDDSGRLIGGLFWKMLRLMRGDTDAIETISQVADYTAGQVPSVSPAIEALSTTSQFVAGRNPYDTFRGRSVFTEDEWKARDARTLAKFLGWEFQQLGGGIVWKFYPGEQRPRELTTGQKLLELPVLSNIIGRFIRITNYGEVETNRRVQADVERHEARRRLTEREQVNKAIQTLQQALEADRTPGRRWQMARDIVNKVYAGESAQERGRRTNLVVKKLAIGTIRGDGDALTDSVLAAGSNDQKIAILRAARDRMGAEPWLAWVKAARRHDVVSEDVVRGVLRRRPTPEEAFR